MLSQLQKNPLLHSRLNNIINQCEVFKHSPIYPAVIQLLTTSHYAQRQLHHINQILQADNFLRTYHYAQELNGITLESFSLFANNLRNFRHYHFIRLLLKEHAGLASTEETLQEWSDCAEALILHALHYCQFSVSIQYGQPYDETGQKAQLYTIGMGKLGGRELNFSSDIDLIFAFSATGFTKGPTIISNQEYYIRVIQLFIKLMQSSTENGFIFRVDLRLRPNGQSGPLITSLTALEIYYQEQGRDWERYAMIKARVLGSPLDSTPPWFSRLINPFTYKRYIDFSVIESLRSMKLLIEQEVRLNPHQQNIKKGLGGIREIEFIIQNIQLIRGGRIIALRQQNTLTTLKVLKKEKLFPHTMILRKAYLFLRKLENYLQSLNDEQTHTLPDDPVKRAQIAAAMHFPDAAALSHKLQQYQHIVRTIFQSTLGKIDEENSQKLLTKQLNSVWQGNIEQSMAINLLANLGFRNANECYQMIDSFKNSPKCRHLSAGAKLRLDRFMGLFLTELLSLTAPELALLSGIKLVENIIGRTAYLALLTENPHVVKELIYWFTFCPFMTSLIVEHPFLLEFLLTEISWKPLSKGQLAQQLKIALNDIKEEEEQQYVLRQFKLTHWLLVARAEAQEKISVYKVGQFLADIAEVIIQFTIDAACEQLMIRYPKIVSLRKQFAVLIYGRVGSKEMNYNSDIDLVFIHDNACDDENLMLRLTQKIIHLLTMRLQTGVLYKVDMRLRPSGSAGLLLSTFTAFKTYQINMAWTWEHQALIRARMITPSSSLKKKFHALKQSIFNLPRNPQILIKDFIQMQEKIVKYLGNDDIKYIPGGLVDLDFLIQFLILSNPLPDYYLYTHTLQMIRYLQKNKIITILQAKEFSQIFYAYQKILHNNVLFPDKKIKIDKKYQQYVLKWKKYYLGIDDKK